MELKIFWTDFSKRELNRIFNYHKMVASIRVARELVTGITEEVAALKSHPRIGQQEPHLIAKEQEFRYIVYRNYKVIYWHNIKKNRIEIIDVFDTRQHPIKIHRSL